MKILAFDPGYARLGWAYLEIETKHSVGAHILKDYGLIETGSKEEMPQRLAYIFEASQALIQKTTPDFLAMEKLYFMKNKKTAVGVFQVQGLLLSLAGLSSLCLYELEPKIIKKTLTGNGNASKEEVLATINKVLNIIGTFKTDDVGDAVACALAAYFHVRSKNLINEMK